MYSFLVLTIIVVGRYGLQDYGIQVNIRELDELFTYFGKEEYIHI